VEKAHENAPCPRDTKIRTRRRGVQQQGIVPFHNNAIIGDYTADLIVEHHVTVELKVVNALSNVHVPQCRND